MRILIVGESWVTLGTHVKGFNMFLTGGYEEGVSALREALESPDVSVDHMPSHSAATQFPTTLDELQRYGVVIFSDVGSDTLLLHPQTFLHSQRMPNRLHLLRSYVQGGGGFVMVGGYMSFAGIDGRARYHRSPVEEMLPVTISPYDDRVELPEGGVPELVAPDHPVLAGLDGQWPYLLGYNRVEAKPHATLLLTICGDPLLAVGTVALGRAAAFMSDCAPHWGSVEFLQWPGYRRLWRQLIAWLCQSPALYEGRGSS